MTKKIISFVYIVPLASGKGFKIGFSIDPLRRIKELEKRFGALDTSRIVRVQLTTSSTTPLKIEETLKFVFEGARIKNMPSGNGHTEFFKMGCFDEVIDFAKRLVDIRSLHDPNAKIIFGMV